MASASAATPRAGETESGASKWLVAASIMFGTILSVMDVSIVNVAMPHMMGTFAQDLLAITWVSTAYSIAEMIMITMTAWWSTLLGRKRLLLASMALFTLGSVMAGASQTFGQILFWRVVQGAGGGSLIPCSQAILRETFPAEEQGMAMAVYAMGVILAPAVGPIVGGWLIDHYGWRWVFYINLPFCITGMVMIASFVRDPAYLKRGLTQIDWTGIVLLTVGLTALQIVLERGQDAGWFDSHAIVAGTLVSALALIGLVAWEFVSPEPIVDFRLFRNLELSVGSTLGAVLGFVLYGSTFLLPQFTQDLLGYTAYQSGMVLMPRALAMFCLMPLVGRLYNYVSPRIFAALGLGALCLAQWQLSHLSLGADSGAFLAPLILLGIGLGGTMVPLSTVSLSTVPRARMTGASSLFSLTRRIAGNLAYALLATVVDRRSQFHHARLVHDISRSAAPYMQTSAGLTARLMGLGYSHVDAQHRALAVVNSMIGRHTTLMAFNDANWLGLMLAAVMLPFVMLLPRNALSKSE